MMRWMSNDRRTIQRWVLAMGVTISAVAFAQQPAASPAPEPSPYKSVIDASTVTLYRGNQPVLRYRYANVPFKPYVDLLYTPSGVNVLRDSPGDHKHHHGMMFATSVDNIDLWSELAANGRQIHQSLNDVRVGVGGDVQYAGFMDDLAWVDPKAQNLLLAESRRVEVVRVPEQPATLFTWESFLEVPEGKKSVALSGAEYFGLGMRFVQSMDTGGRFLNAEGKTGVEGTNAARSRWCAYTANASGKPVTIAVFAHPGNPRNPATWFTMNQPFAYLAATLDLSKQPLTIADQQPIMLRYGIALWDGTIDSKAIEALYQRWVALFVPPPGADKDAPGQPPAAKPPAGKRP